MNNPSQRSTPFRVLAFLALAAAAPAWAHPGHGDLAGFVQAAVHPWTGVDHVLAAVGAGMVAAHIGGRAGAAVLCAYLGGLVAGVLLGWSGPSWLIEGVLGASVTAMAALLLRSASAGARLAIAMAAMFSVFHGLAHQSEAGDRAALAATVAGFGLSTGVLLLGGFGLRRALLALGVRRQAVAWPLAAVGALLVMKAL